MGYLYVLKVDMLHSLGFIEGWANYCTHTAGAHPKMVACWEAGIICGYGMGNFFESVWVYCIDGKLGMRVFWSKTRWGSGKEETYYTISKHRDCLNLYAFYWKWWISCEMCLCSRAREWVMPTMNLWANAPASSKWSKFELSWRSPNHEPKNSYLWIAKSYFRIWIYRCGQISFL